MLVERVKAGDPGAFEMLYRRHVAAVRKIVGASLRDPEKAADAVQDVFARALERIGGLRDPNAFGGWVRTMARNSATDQHRVRVHSDLDEASDSALEAEDLSPDEQVELRDLAGLVREL